LNPGNRPAKGKDPDDDHAQLDRLLLPLLLP
jgi:hypothetical protein